MNFAPGHSSRSVNNGLPANCPSSRSNASCDSVVLGGRATGELVAVDVSETGLKTPLIDERVIGAGSTRASAALTQPDKPHAFIVQGEYWVNTPIAPIGFHVDSVVSATTTWRSHQTTASHCKILSSTATATEEINA